MDRSFTQYDRFLRLIGGLMNFRKLLTYLTVSTAAVIPFAGAQNPTILQGSYISNVFGNSNFVKNPNAQTNVANVTNATRSTTTPLVATSEFTLALDAGANATWTLRAFDSGMKGQNCEARFSYRGFATATTTAEIVQNSLVVAQLVLTPSTDPRIASINFPCGDLAHLTTFRIAQTTANMTGTNEIGGIYVGLATNMANVAQAEFVGGYTIASRTTNPSTTSATFADMTSGVASATLLGSATSFTQASASVTFNNLPAGKYQVIAPAVFAAGTPPLCRFRIRESTSGQTSGSATVNADNTYNRVIAIFDFSSAGTRTFTLQGRLDLGTTCIMNLGFTDYYDSFQVYRFPSSSELVVTPERQNTFAAAKWTGGSNTFISTNTRSAITGFTGYTSYGKASTTAPVSSMEMTVANIPLGAYKLSANLQIVAESQAAGTVDCYIDVSDDGGSTFTTLQGSTVTYGSAFSFTQVYGGSTFFNYTSLQSSKTFKIFVRKAGGTGQCRAQMDSSNTNIVLEPLDQPSNSALYVQGPVKAAETGAAIPAGYVGEKLEENTNANGGSNTIAVNTGTNIRVLTIPPGVWLVCSGIGYDTSASTSPARVISTLSKTSATNGTSGINRVDSVSLTIGQTAHTPPCAYEIIHQM
jgi:hypothetical protein